MEGSAVSGAGLVLAVLVVLVMAVIVGLVIQAGLDVSLEEGRMSRHGSASGRAKAGCRAWRVPGHAFDQESQGTARRSVVSCP
jgi:hypothetical protein